MDNKTRVYFYTSSHGKASHHFPQCFNPLFKDSTRYSKPVIIASGGRKMDQSVVDQVIEEAEERSPTKQVVVLNFGDNNLRRGKETAAAVSKFFEEIVLRFEQIPFARVVLTSLVPSYGNDSETKEEFNRLNNMLKNLCRNKNRASYSKITKNLKTEDYRAIDGDKFYEDDVHFNATGAEVFANAIYTHLHNLRSVKN